MRMGWLRKTSRHLLLDGLPHAPPRSIAELAEFRAFPKVIEIPPKNLGNASGSPESQYSPARFANPPTIPELVRIKEMECTTARTRFVRVGVHSKKVAFFDGAACQFRVSCELVADV